MTTCSIEDCDRRVAGRGLCKMHWTRWRKHGDPLRVKRAGVDFNAKTRCVIEECEQMAHAHGYCSKHLRRWEKHGDPHHVGPILGRPLKGRIPTYAAIHKRLSRSRGPASRQICVDCGGQAREWSYDNNDPDAVTGPVGRFQVKYSLDIAHYVPRCTPCHRLFDIHVSELTAEKAWAVGEKPGVIVRVSEI